MDPQRIAIVIAQAQMLRPDDRAIAFDCSQLDLRLLEEVADLDTPRFLKCL